VRGGRGTADEVQMGRFGDHEGIINQLIDNQSIG
jgi:hypothetical protein